MNVDTIVVILKIAERCNINCTYCYFFNGKDSSFIKHPGKIKLDKVVKVANYFKHAVLENSLKTIRIDFHGGEPLLVKPKYLSQICDIFLQILKDVVKLEFTVQTNGMLINEEWISIFNYYKINVGISLDGPAEYHDKYRIDHKNQGTYHKTREKIDLLRLYYREKKINFGVGILSVINPEFSAKKIYRHFVDELKINSFDFLFPDHTWNSLDSNKFSPLEYGKFLCELFEEWIKDNNPKIYIRILNSIIAQLNKSKINFHDFGGWIDNFLLITISSNGDISPDDTYRSANPEFMQTKLNVDNSVFSDLLHHPTLILLYESSKKISNYCSDCNWVSFCKSGSLLHRYSEENNFDRHSIYCEGLKIIYQRVSEYLLVMNRKACLSSV